MPTPATVSGVVGMYPQADKVLQQIYRDYQNKADQFRTKPTERYASDIIWNEAMRCRTNNLCLGVQGGTRARLIFTAILSISETYMETLTSSTENFWIAIVQLLRENKSSIEFFARSRGVMWLKTVRDLIPKMYPNPDPELYKLFPQSPLDDSPEPNGISDVILHKNLIDHGPNTFYLSKVGTIIPILAPTYNLVQPRGLQIIDINDCTYDREFFQQYGAPEGWPWHYYPRHPQLCKMANTEESGLYIRCPNCHFLHVSDRYWDEPNIGCKCNNWCTDVLIQVVEYSPFSNQPNVVNRGVRALQDIEANTVIGEYTGKLVPAILPVDNVFYDPTYSFRLDSIESGSQIADISSRLHGNWTRFINHDDNKNKVNIRFRRMQVKNRSRIVIITVKKIKFGEELLGNYGPDYFVGMFQAP